jgi:hypothetical protein
MQEDVPSPAATHAFSILEGRKCAELDASDLGEQESLTSSGPESL